MGLRQKSKRLRFGGPEYAALALMVVAAASAVAWWMARPAAGWQVVPARVIGASLVENDRPISASRPAIQLHYSFTVAGRTYTGSTPWDAIARVRYRALPPEVQSLLAAKGYHSFKDLPPEVQEILRNRGIHRIDAVPEPLLDTLRAQGFNSVQDFPADVKAMVRAGEYKSAAAEMERLMAERMKLNAADDPGATPLHQGGIILIRSDPEDPTNHYVVRWPVLDSAASTAILVGSMLLLIFYCGAIYPRVKRR